MKSRTLEKLGALLLFLALSALLWGWQYLKFKNGHGIFYFLSPTYGVHILTIVIIVMFLCALALASRPGGK